MLPDRIRGLLAPGLPALGKARSRVLAIITGATTFEKVSRLPPDTYRIEMGPKQPGNKWPHKVANPSSSIWAGANEPPGGSLPNARYVKLEVDCKSIAYPTTTVPQRHPSNRPTWR